MANGIVITEISRQIAASAERVEGLIYGLNILEEQKNHVADILFKQKMLDELEFLQAATLSLTDILTKQEILQNPTVENRPKERTDEKEKK